MAKVTIIWKNKARDKYYLSLDKNHLLEIFVRVSIFATEKETITNSLKKKNYGNKIL